MKNLKTKIGELLRLAGWQNYWLIYIAVLTVLPSGLWIARLLADLYRGADGSAVRALDRQTVGCGDRSPNAPRIGSSDDQRCGDRQPSSY